MTDKIANLGNKRLERTGDDPRSWTPVECLRQLLDDIESGAVDAERVICVIQGKEQENGIRNTGYYQAAPEHAISLGMLLIAANQIAADAEISE